MKNAGFTLLEVMIAMAILAIGLTSLFGSQTSSVALATETRFNVQAPLLARLQLSTLQSSEEGIFADNGDFGDEYPGFKWELLVEDADFQDSELLQQLNESMQHLTLTVTWGEDLYSYQLDSFQRSEQ
ncbi:MAG TPA: prepilin-type N-terminal cleavage/methylation domain-containing protein [Desulfobacterales bacterium]|nr:prepilin-type N-terminal cleavage/methylation domain-containing protein [Desulfobacterales bacterium]